ncbi:uncharacterized protein LOC129694469 [Leucoraja erinacea]|uniref:uncharacterized protein LOC129694469 n=1 Tax=Leucoraja erinaceus TaxID=7782 RepID=UPI0024578B04|nr:uncharacterized protein LOC129694469 [Leucoraja erinacea]
MIAGYLWRKRNSDTEEESWRTMTSVLLIYTDVLLIVFLTAITIILLITGSIAKDNVAVAVSITMLILLVAFFMPFVYLLRKINLHQENFLISGKWLSICKAGYLSAILIAVISWVAIEGISPEDTVTVITLIMGLVLSTIYAIAFLCWAWKGFPGNKWWWILKICSIVSLVVILIALICWIVFKDQDCDTNIPIWIIPIVSMVTCVIALSRSFPVCQSIHEETNRDSCAERKQDNGELQELQTIRPDHESGPQNLQQDQKDPDSLRFQMSL